MSERHSLRCTPCTGRASHPISFKPPEGVSAACWHHDTMPGWHEVRSKAPVLTTSCSTVAKRPSRRPRQPHCARNTAKRRAFQISCDIAVPVVDRPTMQAAASCRPPRLPVRCTTIKRPHTLWWAAPLAVGGGVYRRVAASTCSAAAIAWR
jgi:hypothetical protein